MSERAPISPEQNPVSIEELHRRHQEALKQTIEKGQNAKHEHAEKIESLRQDAENEAESAKDVLEKHSSETKPDSHEQPAYINRELKNIAYQRTLKRARSHMSPPARVLSRIMHNPAVEAISEAGGKTVARPSGVLAGGIMAFLGSSASLWIARHYGYEFNFLLFVLLFLAGFFIGLVVEFLVRVLLRRRP
ncbi:hypothetical protein H0V99_00710 [Candidatus Saccharibacteria bacterium]|nr:hypothetical protein [Candidatus Saccharibacteria bacterium]